MTIFNFASDEHAYREQTAGQVAMAGVTGPSFVCRSCRRVRRTTGRKKTAGGWRCAECRTKPSARAADA